MKINILTGLDDIQAVLDDHFIKTISIRSSAFVKPIEYEVKVWFDTINRMIMVLEKWERVQKQWLCYMPLFNSKDIVAQMPNEEVLFNVNYSKTSINILYVIFFLYVIKYDVFLDN